MLLWLLHYFHQLQYCWMLLLHAICPFGYSLLQHQHFLDLKDPNPELALAVLLFSTGLKFLVPGSIANPTPLRNRKGQLQTPARHPLLREHERQQPQGWSING